MAQWAARLRARRLDGVVGVLLDMVEPLGPLGAQMLYVAQPALSLFMSRHTVQSLARVLEQPGGVAWLREQLTDETHGQP